MFELIQRILTNISQFHLNILILLGIVLFGGTIGGRLFQKFRIPQVVGYIIIGIIIGQTGLNIVNEHIVNRFQPFNYFALGLIGFMIGGELKKDVFKKYGKQFIYILFSEGLGAFFTVSILTIIVGSILLKDMKIVIALGLLLGAIASATAPAATTDVLWEYKSRGPLTTTVLGIVALDDALSLFLFAIVTSIAGGIIGAMKGGFLNMIFVPVYEIVGAILIGTVSGFVLTKIIKRYGEEDRIFTFTIGTVLLVLGTALILNMDTLLAAMTLGVLITNYNPRKSKIVFNLVNRITAPIYILFFVLFGAKLNVNYVSISMALLALVYLIGRTLGKGVGATFGAKLSKAPKTVQKYLPLCLFSQAGVAIGLSIYAAHHFSNEIGSAIVTIIMVTTFVVQIIGPPMVRLAVFKSKEAGLNITEQDFIKQSKVKDIMDKDVPVIYENMKISSVLKIFAQGENLYYPVVDKKHHLLGIITINSVKNAFTTAGLRKIALAFDLMEPVTMVTNPEASMLEVNELLKKHGLDYLPVVDNNNKLVSLLETHSLHKIFSKKLIQLQGKSLNT